MWNNCMKTFLNQVDTAGFGMNEILVTFLFRYPGERGLFALWL